MMQFDRKQCKGCYYFKTSNGSKTGERFCNYMLDTGKRRERESDYGKCLSYTKKGKKRHKMFEIPLEQAGDFG